jgi:DNA-binding transcriptional MocR family regulator
MFYDLKLNDTKPVYLQIKDYIKSMILSGMLQKDIKLPSTRELSSILNVSRNTVIEAYKYLEDEGFVYTVRGRGFYVSNVEINRQDEWNFNWSSEFNSYAKLSEELDIVKSEPVWKKGMISFKSIAPDNSYFDVEEVKKAFLNRMALEGDKLLNYGYAKGYKPLIEYLMKYMEGKGVVKEGKDILITNGFTEAFDILLSSLTNSGDKIICENPTHNTAIKIMKLHGLNIEGVELDDDGINLEKLKNKITKDTKLAYLIPSYHNPTGIIMPPEKRIEVFNIFKEYNVPIIEDGFNEELRYSGSHVAPIAALCGKGNGVIYIGSFSKVLFPGLRIGWIMADKDLISVLESVKRSRNIHTSFIDQAILFEYLNGGNFEKYIKRVRKIYKEKYEWAVKCAKKYIPNKKILGEGGLHIFLELSDEIDARDVLSECMKKGVIFMPGDIFYTDGRGKNTLRLGFSRNSIEEIEKGFKIIGNVVKNMNMEVTK